MTEPTLPAGFSRETTIVRDADGRWFHDGAPVENPAVAKAFDRWVDRADDGRYILKNSVNWAYVKIDGAPLFVRRLEIEADQVVLFLSDDTSERLDPDTLRQDSEGRIYCTARNGRMTAQFQRRAQMELMPLVEEHQDEVGLSIGGRRVVVPERANPLK